MSSMRTTEPSLLARTTMSPNCSADCNCPRVDNWYWMDGLSGTGGWPMLPAAMSLFWFWIAVLTSSIVIPRAASFSGSSQMRIE